MDICTPESGACLRSQLDCRSSLQEGARANAWKQQQQQGSVRAPHETGEHTWQVAEPVLSVKLQRLGVKAAEGRLRDPRRNGCGLWKGIMIKLRHQPLIC